MNKIVIAIIVVVIVALGGYFLLGGTTYKTPNPSLPSQTPDAQSVSSSLQNVIIYSKSEFSPNTLRVKVGETVVFKNGESKPMWVASNPHPIHTDYLGFDAKRGYVKDESHSFTFTKLGTWEYHNHLDPNNIGTVIVEK